MSQFNHRAERNRHRHREKARESQKEEQKSTRKLSECVFCIDAASKRHSVF